VKSIGSELVYSTGDGVRKTTDALYGKKTIMLYFSAHWCHPCQRFTLKLIEFYNGMKKTGKHDFELIFVSFDKKEDQYNECISRMPWPCIPFENDSKETLARKYETEGIPHLVVVDENGKVITKDGVDGVFSDESAEYYPWRPKRLCDLWPMKILTKGGLVDSSTLDDKYLMLYFSAHWCPPCRDSIPLLSEAYTKLKAKRDDFEVSCGIFKACLVII